MRLGFGRASPSLAMTGSCPIGAKITAAEVIGFLRGRVRAASDRYTRELNG